MENTSVCIQCFYLHDASITGISDLEESFQQGYRHRNMIWYFFLQLSIFLWQKLRRYPRKLIKMYCYCRSHLTMIRQNQDEIEMFRWFWFNQKDKYKFYKIEPESRLFPPKLLYSTQGACCISLIALSVSLNCFKIICVSLVHYLTFF